MSSSNFPNHDDDLHDGESSNPQWPPYVAPGYLEPTHLFIHNFVMNMPAMLTHWQNFNLEEAESSQNPPTVTIKKRKPIKRDRDEAQNRIVQYYFAPSPERTFTDAHFRNRFRMHRPLFQRIVDGVCNYHPFFQQRPDACGKLGFTGLHKCTVAIRHLAYGCAFDQLDECLAMGETTVRDSVEAFIEAVIAVFKEQYLRPTSPDDIDRLNHVAKLRGFPGMLGSIDCMHWEWKNCPTAWRGQFQGRGGYASIILEAVASYDTHIWHAFFGCAGSNNDINVLDKSPLFDDVCEGRVPEVPYVVNGNPYHHGYYLADGIYPKWAAFMPAYTAPNEAKKKTFTERQESYRKDVERAFGILQSRFAVIRNPAKYWELSTVSNIMIACIILHNMIVEDERDTYGFSVKPGDYEQVDHTPWHYNANQRAELADYRQTWREIRSRELHEQLKHDLTEHLALHVERTTPRMQ